MNRTLKYGFLTMGLCSLSLPAAAIDTGVEGLTLDGRLKQGVSVAYDLDGQSDKSGPANYVAEVKSTYSPTGDLTFIGNFWLRGDLSTGKGRIMAPSGGLSDPTSPNFASNYPMALDRKNCNSEDANPNKKYCADSSEDHSPFTN